MSRSQDVHLSPIYKVVSYTRLECLAPCVRYLVSLVDDQKPA